MPQTIRARDYRLSRGRIYTTFRRRRNHSLPPPPPPQTSWWRYYRLGTRPRRIYTIYIYMYIYIGTALRAPSHPFLFLLCILFFAYFRIALLCFAPRPLEMRLWQLLSSLNNATFMRERCRRA